MMNDEQKNEHEKPGKIRLNLPFIVHHSSFIVVTATTVALLVAGTSCTFEPSARSGGPVVEIGRRGASPGHFNSPRAIVAAPNNDLYVIDRTGRIQRLAPDGTCRAVWKVPEAANGTPTGAALDRNGDLLVADTHYSRILRYSADGTSRTQFGRYGNGPGETIYPQDVAVDGEGNIYVASYGGRDKIIKFRSDGTFIKEWGESGEGPGQFRRPMALAVRGNDELVVADSCNHRIQRFDLEGRFLGMLGGVGRDRGQLNYPYDVVAGPKGEIYVCEYGNNRVTKFTREGRATTLGKPGNGLGQLRGPWGLALDRAGYLYVADTYNHRIQRFAPGAI
jgi:DNA-binding beta-propeller fold protein YncE